VERAYGYDKNPIYAWGEADNAMTKREERFTKLEVVSIARITLIGLTQMSAVRGASEERSKLYYCTVLSTGTEQRRNVPFESVLTYTNVCLESHRS